MNNKFISRLSFLLALFLGQAGMAVADHNVSISDFSIKAGEEKTIEVDFTSDASDIYYVNGTIDMPEGIEVVVSSGMAQVATTSRTSGFSINMNLSTGLFRLTSLVKNAITGTSGAIATIKVKAADDLADGTKTIALSDFTVKHTDGDGTEEAATTGNATVTCEAATVTPEPVTTGPIVFSPATLSLAAGKTAEVEVIMQDNVKMVGFDALFATSEGLSIEGVTGATYTKRTKKVTIEEIAANVGTLFTVTIKAEDSFSGEGTVTLKNIVAYDPDETIEDPYEFDDITLVIAPEAEPETETASFAFDFEGDIDLIPGESVEVPVTLTNGCTLSGFQATMTLPSGVTAELVKSDRLAAAPNYNEENGNINYLGGISGKDGVLFTLKLTAGDDFADGTLILSNLKATTPSSHSITANPASISLNVKKGTDNIAFAFSETEVKLAAGESVDVDVTLTNDRARAGFGATLTLPEGITATLTKSDRLASDPTYREGTGNITYLGGIKGNDGVLFTITLTAGDEFAADGTVTLTNLKTTTASSKSSKADDIELTVKFVTKYTLDETSSEPIVAGTYNTVTLKRNFRAGFNTVCLPFAIDDVAEFFGEGAKVYAFTGYENVEGENILKLDLVSGGLETCTPYVVYVETAFSEKELTDVEIAAEAGKVTKEDGASFIGTFAPIDAPGMAGKYGVTDKAKIAKGNEEAYMKGFRAYFEITGSTPSRLAFSDGSTTNIEGTLISNKQTEVYNLNGQKMLKASKGVFIIDGKKVIVK
ncbi:MAG: hypothetical protein IJ887_14590 [Prevotella sp.]|nr:hypothetical protein [Prevotella sp.]MBR6190101.1 hypothetical protein [Prevotella sp.]